MDKDFCKSLHDTYDTNMLKRLPKNEQDFFYAASKYSGKDEGFSTLKYLITNGVDKKMPTPKAITGPYTLSYHTSKKYNKKIYIFGEKHGYEGNCKDQCKNTKSRNRKTPPICDWITMSDYLENLFDTSNVFIDFYLEVEELNDYLNYKWFDIMQLNSYLAEMRAKFRHCIEKQQLLRCKTGRFHYTDIRVKNDYEGKTNYVNVATNSLGKFERELTTLLDKELITLDKDKVMVNQFIQKYLKENPELRDLLHTFAYGAPKDTFKKLYKIYLSNSRVKKELNRTYLKKDIERIFRKLVVLKLKHYSHFSDTVKNTLNGSIKPDRIPKLSTVLVLLNSPIVDLYTICRIFKKFKNVVDQPEEPANIIIHAGNEHSNNFRYMLGKLGFESIFYTENSRNDRCLDMSEIKKPLFQTTYRNNLY